MSLLVTGGAGYIGSHTCAELLCAGEDIVVMDNFSNSSPKALDGIRAITGKNFRFYEADMLDNTAVEKIFSENDIKQVIHFAGYKCVPESVKNPLKYYSNNICGTLNILETMRKYGCKRFVFSSSATVYGEPESVPVREDFPLRAINPYGSTKLAIENLCRELNRADSGFTAVLLRYFNPIGAHESGLIGEAPLGLPNNLMPIVIEKALGKRDYLAVAGDDYPTSDGSCVRDYIHVVDLAKGHVAAVKKARALAGGCPAYNLGTGRGYSVFEILDTFERVNSLKLGYVVGPRREGDAPAIYSDPSLAEKELGWKAELGIEEMCRSAWNFAKNYF